MCACARTHTHTQTHTTDTNISQNDTCFHYRGQTHSNTFLYSIILLFLFYITLFLFLFLFYSLFLKMLIMGPQFMAVYFSQFHICALTGSPGDYRQNHKKPCDEAESGLGYKAEERRKFWRIPRREETFLVSKIMKGYLDGGHSQKSTSKSQCDFNYDLIKRRMGDGTD